MHTARQLDILLVDDDDRLTNLLLIRLRHLGYRAKAAASAEAALSCIDTLHPRVLVTDLCMPGMDGIGLFDEVQKRFPGLPVIILTAHGSIPEAVSATRAGVYDFIAKPFDSNHLVQRVQSALALAGHTGQVADAWRSHMVTRSAVMETVLSEARLIAASEASVFITGESGTGKELLAKAVHLASRRRNGPFVAVNSGAVPAELLESELFGHVKGAFTGARADHEGLFRAAHGGTLFLDEIGDMPPPLQVKLLRALQERQVRPIGSTRSQRVDVRIISATHRDLSELLAANQLREDLYYRLNVVTLALPPLRERREDITLLAEHFLQQLAQKRQRTAKRLSRDAKSALITAQWPGNIRQLFNVVEFCDALSASKEIGASLVRKALPEEVRDTLSLTNARHCFERGYLMQLLHATAGNMTRAAHLAKRNRTDLYRLLSRHTLDPRQFKRAADAARNG